MFTFGGFVPLSLPIKTSTSRRVAWQQHSPRARSLLFSQQCHNLVNIGITSAIFRSVARLVHNVYQTSTLTLLLDVSDNANFLTTHILRLLLQFSHFGRVLIWTRPFLTVVVYTFRSPALKASAGRSHTSSPVTTLRHRVFPRVLNNRKAQLRAFVLYHPTPVAMSFLKMNDIDTVQKSGSQDERDVVVHHIAKNWDPDMSDADSRGLSTLALAAELAQATGLPSSKSSCSSSLSSPDSSLFSSSYRKSSQSVAVSSPGM